MYIYIYIYIDVTNGREKVQVWERNRPKGGACCEKGEVFIYLDILSTFKKYICIFGILCFYVYTFLSYLATFGCFRKWVYRIEKTGSPV